MAKHKSRTWVLYEESYLPAEAPEYDGHKTLVSVFVHGTYAGSDGGKASAVELATKKAQQFADRFGGSVKTNDSQNEFRTWVDNPTAAHRTDFRPVLVVRLVAHRAGKRPPRVPRVLPVKVD